MYIKPPPMEFQPITVHKGKCKRIKRAKKRDVPIDYRKNRKAKRQNQIDELKWQIALILNDIRKVIHNDY